MRRILAVTLFAVALIAQGAMALAQEDAKPVAPFRIFDNLYYVGLDSVGAYVLKTSDGLILIDALFFEFAGHLPKAIQQVGLNPRDIKYVIVTHAHVDHTGAAKVIQDLSGARVGMTLADWEMVERGEYMSSQGQRRIFQKIPRDLVIEDGDTITLGDASLKLYVTPGHTPGVTSLEFLVDDGGKKYKAFMFGGIGLNTVNGVRATQQYIESVKRVMAVPDVQASISNHPTRQFFEVRDKLAARKPGDPHPLVDPAGFRSSSQAQLANAEKKLAAESAAGRP